MKKIFIFIICMFSIFSFAEEDIGKIRDMIAIVNPAEKRLAKAIKDASEKSGIPSEVLVAKFTNESGFGKKLDNSLGYVGIGQMGAAAFETGLREMGYSKETAHRLANQYNTRKDNKELGILAAAGYLKYHLDRSNGQMGAALSKYAGGAGTYNAMNTPVDETGRHYYWTRKNGKRVKEYLSNEREKEQASDLYKMNLRANILKKIKEGKPLTAADKKILTGGIPNVPINSYYSSLNALNKGISGKTPDFSPIDDEYGTYNQKAANYLADINYDWDGFATMLAGFVNEGLAKLKTTAIVLLSLCTLIQLTLDMAHGMANVNIKAIMTTLFKKLLSFSFYLVIINKIMDGSLLQLSEDVAYGVVTALTKTSGVQNISNLWTVKEGITGVIWNDFKSLWGWSSIVPSEFGHDLVFSIIYLFMIAIVNLAIFMMMANLFKALISFQLVLGLSQILLPFGMIEYTKGYYSIGKVLSLTLNFIVKLISINVIAVIIMRMFQENNDLFNFANITSVTDLINGNGMIAVILILIVYELFTKIEVSF